MKPGGYMSHVPHNMMQGHYMPRPPNYPNNVQNPYAMQGGGMHGQQIMPTGQGIPGMGPGHGMHNQNFVGMGQGQYPNMCNNRLHPPQYGNQYTSQQNFQVRCWFARFFFKVKQKCMYEFYNESICSTVGVIIGGMTPSMDKFCVIYTQCMFCFTSFISCV